MTWNEQTDGQTDGQITSAPDSAPRYGMPSAPEFQVTPPLSDGSGDTMNRPGLPGLESDMPREKYLADAAPVNPLIRQGQPSVSQPAVALAAGMASGPLPVQSTAAPLETDDESDVDDIVWVNRAKRIIASTHGDPHRQVQLLQQLSVVYLKERYGRSVHADEV
jgi:hypothetical protein